MKDRIEKSDDDNPHLIAFERSEKKEIAYIQKLNKEVKSYLPKYPKTTRDFFKSNLNTEREYLINEQIGKRKRTRSSLSTALPRESVINKKRRECSSLPSSSNRQTIQMELYKE
jgi:hypothetical protein